MNVRHMVADTELGPLTLVSDGDALVGVYFRHHVRRPAEALFGARVGDDTVLTEAARQIDEYLAGGRQEFELPLAPVGSEFQLAVWTALQEIPYGSTTSYGAIAARLGSPGTAWQVGQAVGANPLCVLIPCHRVVGASGALTGYAGGLQRKRALLDLETRASAAPHLPLQWA